MRVVKSNSNVNANFLLGFSYNEEDPHDGSYSTSYNSKRGGGRSKRGGGGPVRYRPLKDYSVQSAFKFIVRNNNTENDFMLNLFDPNEAVEWKDVVQVIFNMINASDV
jgi:hypothetical protein